MSWAPWSGRIPCNDTGGRAMPPNTLPGHEACSTKGEGDRCRCKSQQRSQRHRLEQVGSQFHAGNPRRMGDRSSTSKSVTAQVAGRFQRLSERVPFVTKAASSSANHPSKVPFTKV